MITFHKLSAMALSFPEATEEPHFEKTSFRVRKKIFATCDKSGNTLTIRLSETDQDVFCVAGRSAIYPVPNKWGKQGWTVIELEKVDKDVFADALTTAYCQVAPKKLVIQVRPGPRENNIQETS